MRIVLLTDENKEIKFDSNDISCGRERDNLLCLEHDGISRYHGKITKDEESGKFFVIDNDSTNGIFVNSKRVVECQEIKDGDIVQFYNIKTQVFDLYNTPKKSEPKMILTEVVLGNKEIIKTEEPKAPEVVVHETPKNSKIITETPEEKPKIEEANEDKGETEINDFSEYLKNNSLFGKDKNKNNSSKDKQNNKQEHKSKLSNISFILIVVGLVIICFMVFILLEKNSKTVSDNSETTTTVAKINNQLSLIYRKEFIENNNIYNFKLLIENNKAYFTVDDLKSQLSVGPIEKSMSELDVSRIRQGITDSDFLNIKENKYLGTENSQSSNRKEIIVFLGDKNNSVQVVNSSAPREFLDFEDILNDYILDADLPFLTLSSEDLAERAKDSFLRAEDLLANYEANLGNLKEAIIEYNIVVSYLAGFSPEPRTRKVATKQLNKAMEIRNSLYRQLRSEYDTFINKKDYMSAKVASNKIMELFDIDSKEYEFFKDKSIKIDDILRRANTGKRK